LESLFAFQLLVAALVTGFLYALVALGLNMIYGTMRLLNIAHGEIVMVGAYVAYWMFTLFHVGPLVSAFLAIALGAAIGVAAYYGVFRAVLRNSRLVARLEANSLLIFFGVSVILQNVAAIAFTANQRGYRYLDTVLEFGSGSILASRLVVLVVSAAACIGLVIFMKRSVMGQAIRALIQNRDAAAIVGVDIDRVQTLSFAIGFGAAALAGALVSMLETITPFMGFPFTIAGFIVIILGGLGNLTGGLIAALLLGVIETYGVALTSSEFRSILIYGVFILVLMWRPQGLFGTRSSAQ
jgi:branched-chain amino acid transport system permease protein